MHRKRRRNSRQPELLIFAASVIGLAIIVALTSGNSLSDAAKAFVAPFSIAADRKQEQTHIILSPDYSTHLSDEAAVSETPAPETEKNINLFAKTDNKTILIYHTHTLEAYTQTAEHKYKEYNGRWRTDDTSCSVVAVGEKLAEELRARGFNVLHDTTNHEPPKLSTAYDRSLVTMQNYKKKYPDISLYIDLHRDATDEDNTSDFCIVNGVKTAKVMFVVGHGTKYDDKPDYDKNYAAASAVTEYLRSINPSLARNIREKPGRYNQHVGECCMLIEIGHNMNTLEQALAATEYVADGIATLY